MSESQSGRPDLGSAAHAPSDNSSPIAYATVVAANYIPQVLALFDSIQRHSPDIPLHVLVLDADDRKLRDLQQLGIQAHSPEFLQIGDRAFFQLATIYDVVELATAIKPLFFLRLLGDFEHVTYLDPDTYLVTPLADLPDLVSRHGTVLTPHFLDPIAPGSSYMSENHCLTVGVYNLGFGAFSRTSRPLLEWWWGHLERECLKYPLLGLFVDQKWMDLAPGFFPVHSLTHRGYNVGPWNFHERPLSTTEDGNVVASGSEPLRLMHFSGFDPTRPEELSERLNIDLTATNASSATLSQLAAEYATLVLRGRELIPSSPTYGFSSDIGGKRINRRLRQAYRESLLNNEELPIPFIEGELSQFRQWSRGAWAKRQGIRTADIAIAAKYAFPDAYDSFRKRHGTAFRTVRARLLDSSKVRR